MVKRAEDISTSDYLLKKEIQHLRSVLEENGYPTNMVNHQKVKSRRAEEENKEGQTPLAMAIILYTQGLSEQIR